MRIVIQPFEEKCILNPAMAEGASGNCWELSSLGRILALLLFLPCLLSAASTEWKVNPEGQVRLISAQDRVPKSGEVLLGLHFKTAPGWYVYWKVPGDAGYPPKVQWTASEGISRFSLYWPAPTKFVLPGNIFEYGYEGEVVYPVTGRVNASGTRVKIVSTISYLTCNTSCVPYKYTFDLDLPIGESKPDIENQTLIEKFIAQVPPAKQTDSMTMSAAKVWQKPQSDQPPTAPLPRARLSWIFLLAFLGGVILNVMPCVLPVLSIKLLGLLQHGGQTRATIACHALASAGGILFSFMALALAAIAARDTGHAIGWGIQFQEPLFVAFLALIIFLFALNLWGTFEVGMPRLFGQFAVTFGRGETMSAYFISGLFATLLATPCSAPFLGTAMGFALSQPPPVILSIFGAVGAGMAMPYFILAAFPRSLHWLPKPGPWMIHLRTILGFILAATVVWLGFVLSSQIQPAGMAYFYLSLVGIGFAAWLRELLIVHPRLGTVWMRRVTVLILLILVGGSLKIVQHFRLSDTRRPSLSKENLEWTPFDESAVTKFLQEKKTVFVDVTADWCVTCKFNERFVLQDPEIRQVFKRRGVVMMKADWTNRDQAVTDYLMKHGRAGIPFYAFYQPGREPILLSEFLTKRQVLDALGEP